jgi:hypothetical protein
MEWQAAARALRVLIAVAVIDHLALDFEVGGLGLLRCESLMISEISDDGPASAGSSATR